MSVKLCLQEEYLAIVQVLWEHAEFAHSSW